MPLQKKKLYLTQSSVTIAGFPPLHFIDTFKNFFSHHLCLIATISISCHHYQLLILLQTCHYYQSLPSLSAPCTAAILPPLPCHDTAAARITISCHCCWHAIISIFCCLYCPILVLRHCKCFTHNVFHNWASAAKCIAFNTG